MLRELHNKTGITRDQFIAHVGVSHISIDNWFDGKIRPSSNRIAAITEAFSKLIPGSNRQALAIQLQRQFTCAYLGDMLEEKIGRDKVIDLATALYRFIFLISEDIRTMDRPPMDKAAGAEFEILKHGVDHPYSRTLLRNLASVEMDAKWKKEILASVTGWSLRFEEIASSASLPGSSAGLAQNLPEDALKEAIKDGTQADLQKLKEASGLQAIDYQRIAAGDLSPVIESFNDGLNDRRLIVKQHPLSPEAHLHLGSFLGMVGKHTGNINLINEGINECKMAAVLCPGWDNPLVEPAIILINVRRYEEALKELEYAASKLPAVTPHLAMNRGYALMQLKKYELALQDFEFVISVRPNYALALDYAAHCALTIGDYLKGGNYAKEARKYGVMQAYEDWQKGKYRKR
jgi:hypothetical protein